MILPNGHSTLYLSNILDGKIKKGLGIGCDFDNHFLHKQGELNILLGHDNVGKTYWGEWYFLVLAVTHGLKFTIFMDENDAWKVMRDLIQMWLGKPFENCTHQEVRSAEALMEYHFNFIDNRQRYTPKELTDVWLSSETETLLIDPFNGLKTPFSYSENYEVLNDLKMINKREGKTIYINAHPSSASGRSQGFHPKGHSFEGYLKPPFKDDIEGGKPFTNKADNFMIAHRYTQHEQMRHITTIAVAKIKDTFTGGSPTLKDKEVYFEYNHGNGFIINGIDPMPRKGAKSYDEQKEEFQAKLLSDETELHRINNNLNIKPNAEFETEYDKNKPSDLPF